jgi:hypothetical protein
MHGSDSQHYLEEAMAAPAKGMSSDRTCLSRRLLIDLGIHLVAVWAAGRRRNSGPRAGQPVPVGRRWAEALLGSHSPFRPLVPA